MAGCIGRLRQIPKVFWLILLFVVSGQVMLIFSLASPHWSVITSSSNSSEVSEVTVGIWKICFVIRSVEEDCVGTGSYQFFTKIRVGLVMAVVIGFLAVVLSVLFVIKPGLCKGSRPAYLAMSCLAVAVCNIFGLGFYISDLKADSMSIPFMDNPTLEVSWAEILNGVGCGLYLISFFVEGAFYLCSPETSGRSLLT